jgi:LDH2 family malate/lactate/ureidoglycolate dehydrogenase
MRIKSHEIKQLYLSVLGQMGVPNKEIQVVADAAIFASLRGIDTHGFIPVLTRVIKEIKAVIVKPNAKIQIIKEDKNGHPTTDPQAALEGVILPMGGHKGYGLGLVVDVFTAALAGSLIAKEIPPYSDLSTPYGASYFMMAIRVGGFAGIEPFKHRVDRLIRDCKSCAPMEGFREVLVPGEIEFREAQKRDREGIPVENERWQDMLEILKRNKIEVDPLLANLAP